MADVATLPPEDNFHNRDAEAILDSAPWASIPEVTTLPEQYWEFRCDDIGASFTNPQDGGTPKLVVDLELSIVKPLDFSQRQHRERYFIGTDNDPRAQQPATWLTGASPGATNLKRLCVLLGVPDWRGIKAKSFATFTQNRESNGRTYTQFQGFEHRYYASADATFAPGTPTPIAQSRRGRMPVGNSNASASATQQDPNTLIACTVGCGRTFKLSEQELLVQHIQQCNGASVA